MAIERTARHMNFGLGLFERMEDKELRRVFTHPGKKPPTVKRIREQLKMFRDKGYDFYPPCDNIDERGACKGGH